MLSLLGVVIHLHADMHRGEVLIGEPVSEKPAPLGFASTELED